MTQRELRLYLSEKFCGCGSPTDAAERLRDLLALHPLYSHREEFRRLVPDTGIEYLLLYMLDAWGLTEHGGTVGGGWLTGEGKAVLDALQREAADGFESVTESCCIHGNVVDGPQCDECCSEIAAPDPEAHG